MNADGHGFWRGLPAGCAGRGPQMSQMGRIGGRDWERMKE